MFKLTFFFSKFNQNKQEVNNSSEKLADQSFIKAISISLELNSSHQAEKSQVFTYLAQAANQGCRRSAELLTEIYRPNLNVSGKVALNLKEEELRLLVTSKYDYQKIKTQVNILSLNFISKFHRLVKQNEITWLEYMELAIKNKSFQCAYQLADHYFYGNTGVNIKPDFSKAILYCEKAVLAIEEDSQNISSENKRMLLKIILGIYNKVSIFDSEYYNKEIINTCIGILRKFDFEPAREELRNLLSEENLFEEDPRFSNFDYKNYSP